MRYCLILVLLMLISGCCLKNKDRLSGIIHIDDSLKLPMQSFEIDYCDSAIPIEDYSRARAFKLSRKANKKEFVDYWTQIDTFQIDSFIVTKSGEWYYRYYGKYHPWFVLDSFYQGKTLKHWIKNNAPYTEFETWYPIREVSVDGDNVYIFRTRHDSGTTNLRNTYYGEVTFDPKFGILRLNYYETFLTYQPCDSKARKLYSSDR